MKTKQIPKKSGGTRTIYIQSPWDKHAFREIGSKLAEYVERLPNAHVIHGFRANHNPVTNAMAHIGFEYTLSIDLKDFFDSVNILHLLNQGVEGSLAKRAMKYGAARQGLSSSPAAANIAGAALDDAIVCRLKPGMVYTRYADDLTISGNDKDSLLELIPYIREEARKYCFMINEKKVRLQSQKFGNRIICGVSVGRTGISVPRKVRRRLRAAMHRYPNSNKTRGLAEWCKLKLPTGKRIGKWRAAAIAEATHNAFKH